MELQKKKRGENWSAEEKVSKPSKYSNSVLYFLLFIFQLK